VKKINDIIKLIKENEYISIFFHTNPDFDALGSSLGLKTFIQKKFVNKKVCVIDLDLVEKSVLSNFPKIKKSKQFNEKETKKSIGIVCDCANIERINSKKYESCKQIVKIDHHPNIQSYGVVN
jgi:phosphoesterase RecJ-like protein